jgi:hypothetical protein
METGKDASGFKPKLFRPYSAESCSGGMEPGMEVEYQAGLARMSSLFNFQLQVQGVSYASIQV